MKRLIAMATLLVASSCPSAAEPGSAQPPRIAAYYASWAARESPRSGFDERLAGLPSGLTEVLLAFVRPDASYSGDLDLTGTGLEVAYTGRTLRDSVAALKAHRPEIRVLASIGGESYSNWDAFAPDAVARLVEDLGLDGIDLDFEPSSPDCREAAGRMSCRSDALLLNIVHAAREALPRPSIVWLTATHTGAYGYGPWRAAPPVGAPSYGQFGALLENREVSEKLDAISIMAYDAGPSFRPLEAYGAYRSRFAGAILIGVTAPPEAWGGHVYSVAEAVETVCTAVSQGAAGAMIFAIGKEPPSDPGPSRPSSDDLVAALIEALRPSGACDGDR